MAGSETPPVALETRAEDGAMLFSPSAGRNKAPIAEALAGLLPQGARVLEIASGTGEHGEQACLRRPDLVWTPSEVDPASRASCAARAAASGGGLRAPLELDVTAPDWFAAAPACDAVFCANMIHIAPWTAAEGLAAGAARLLGADGQVILYGPFLDGPDSAPSNLAFSENLQRRDPSWGVRELADVQALFAACGFVQAHHRAMPANNRMLAFRRSGAAGAT